MALPAPDQAFTPRRSSGGADVSADFDQAGWSLRYDGFMQEGQWTAPRKMVIQGRGVVLKLIVDRWRFDG
ncbi:lipoprotein insertase outer membrane protein LolB [Methylogaea oryzae]|uniref:lipoprotein insertase outer membrane protein LolB n=1 Tax=Methylogaea oryzae TaxID=1295382 RepID=UPI0006CF22D2